MIKKKLLRILLEIQKVSEIVPSDFIIKESDVLITVLEQLSFAEQDMRVKMILPYKLPITIFLF
jgi:hypothetical protein